MHVSRWLLFVVLFASPLSAFAQGCGSSPLSCQQLATQDAINAGIPPQIFIDQIQGESGFNPGIGCNSIGACGIAQIRGSTAANPGYGIAPVNPNDPVAALQFAAQYDAALRAANGGSLTNALTSYTGGCTPLAPCNPAYAQAFQLAQQADANGGSLTDPTTVGDGSTLVGAPFGGAGVNLAAAGSAPTPFTNAYNFIQNTALAYIQGSTPAVQSALTGALVLTLLALTFMIQGWRVMWTSYPFEEFKWFSARIIIVVPLIYGSVWFNAIFTQFIINTMPTWIAGLAGGQATAPTANFDATLLNFWNLTTQIGAQAPGFFTAIGVWGFMIVFFFIIVVALVILFSPFILLVGALALIAGPLMPILLFGLLFEFTRRYWEAGVGVIVTLLLGMFVVDLLSQVIAAAVAGQLAAIQIDNSVWDAVWGTGAAVIDVLIIGALIAIGWKMVQAIGGVAVAINTISPADVVRKAMG